MLTWDVVIEPPASLAKDESIFAKKAYTSDWVARLPVAATAKAANIIYSALGNVTGYELAYDKRLFFLEQTSSITTSLVEGLVKELHQQGLPIKQAAAGSAKEVLDILALRIIGYRQVIDALTASMFTGGLRRKSLLGTSMLRVLELAGQMLDIYRHASVSPCPGLWLLMNRFFAIAEAEGFLNKSYGNLQGTGKTSIATAFKTQILLEGINCYDLRHYELEQTKGFIGSVTKSVVIGTKGDPSLSEHFCFRIDEDHPPSKFAPERERQCESSGARRIVDLIPLIATLNKELSGGGDSAGEQAVRQLAARKLLEGWRVTGEGRDVREDRERRTELAFGLSNIVAALSEQNLLDELQGLETDSSVGGDTEAIIMGEPKETAGFDADIEGIDKEFHRMQMEERHDEWNIMPYSHGKQGDKGSHTVAKKYNASVVNESHGGYGVLLQNSDKANFKVGELVAIDLDRGGVLCAVRWIRQGDNGVSMGLIRLGDNLQPFSLVIRRDDHESQPLPIMLFHHRSDAAAMAMHNLGLRGEQKVSFADSQLLSPSEQLDSSPAFVSYRIGDEVYESIVHASHRQKEAQASAAVAENQQSLEEEWAKLTAELGSAPREEATGYDAIMDNGFDKQVSRKRDPWGDAN